MTEGPAEVLERLYEHYDYYEAMKTVVQIDSEWDVRLRFDIEDVRPEIEARGPRRKLVPRGGFGQPVYDGLLGIWIDRSSSSGEIEETEPWLDIHGLGPQMVIEVEIESGVAFND